ncbi:PH domain-containing protein [Agromyces sp. SYSU T00194]|uniref:PH domain-containing protein n=1 Tax=Agromyces chitinivorans TaxID=3158560 RepID=UPI003391B9A9
MTAPAPGARAGLSTDLADGQWHRLHPLTPLLRGGIFLIALIGFVIANLRERVVDLFLIGISPDSPIDADDFDGDPISILVRTGNVGWGLLIVLGILFLLLGGFTLSWRMHTFRITGEAVEVRSGILFRSHRSARLDRIQGISISRSLVPRLLGAAKLEVAVAGQSASVQLSYLQSGLADALRADILRLASGAKAERAGTVRAAGGAPVTDASGEPVTDASGRAGDGASHAPGLVHRRVDELLAPELDPDLAPPESVVHIPLGRIVGSSVLGGSTLAVLIFAGVITWGLTSGSAWVLFSFVPAVIGLVTYMWSRITKSLRYTIAATPDGVRIGYGLLSTQNDTLPPGRIHAIQVGQPLLWRPFGWWTIRINVAGQSAGASGDAARRSLVLPVGTLDDVRRVLGLLLPETPPEVLDAVTETGLVGPGGDATYVGAPRRAAWLRPFSWRRTGYAVDADVALIRRGVAWRELVIVPLARTQSVAVHRGPLRRALGLSLVRVHTVAGPITATLPVIGLADAEALFDAVAAGAITWARLDVSDHWAGAHAAVAASGERGGSAAGGEPAVGGAHG